MIEEDTPQSGHFEPSIFYKEYIVISQETIS